MTVDRLASMCDGDYSEDDVGWSLYIGSSEGTRMRYIVQQSGTTLRLKPRESTGLCRAPLATISSSRLDVPRLWAAAQRLGDTLAQKMLGYIDGDVIPDALQDIAWQRSDRVSRGFSKADVSMLHETVLVKEQPLLCLPAFKVKKTTHPGEGPTARFIVDCRTINRELEAVLQTPRMPLPDLQSLVDELLRHPCRATVDARSYFYQIPLRSRRLRRLFGVRIGSARGGFDTGVLSALPMGASFAPTTAQALSNLVLRVWQDRLSAQLRSRLWAWAWVDNFVFAADDAVVLQRGVVAFLDTARAFALELKPVDWPSSDGSLTILGIIFKGSTATLHQPEGMELPPSPSKREVLRTFGFCCWGYFALVRQPLCRWHHALESVRRIGRQLGLGAANLDSPCDLVSIEREELLHLFATTRQAIRQATPPCSLQTRAAVWSDASSNVCAGLLQVGDHDVDQWACAGPRASIFLRELFAAAASVQRWAGEGPLTVVTDNRGVYHALLKGHSTSAAADRLLAVTVPRLQGAQIVWVPTYWQRADGLTRGGDVGPQINLPKGTRPKWDAPFFVGG